jgi:hypothetical protein
MSLLCENFFLHFIPPLQSLVISIEYQYKIYLAETPYMKMH